MNHAKNFFSVFLSCVLFTTVVLADGSGIAQDHDLRVNPPGTLPGVTCSLGGETPSTPDGVCCVGFSKNSSGVCDLDPFEDDAIKTCTSHSSCTQGTGCFPQRASDLFSDLIPHTISSDPQEPREEKNTLLELDLDDNLKVKGASCLHARECESYSCVNGKCREKKICRFAAQGESAPSSVQCGPELEKKQGICDLPTEAKTPTYFGLLQEMNFTPTGQCQYEINEKTRKTALVSLQSLRAIEWLFSSLEAPAGNQDCLGYEKVLKNNVGDEIYQVRKRVLSNFGYAFNSIEEDFQKLICARSIGDKSNLVEGCSESSGEKTLLMHGESISEKDLASRQTSGFDLLTIMYRRNLLYKNYEQAMNEVIQDASIKLGSLENLISLSIKNDERMPICDNKIRYKKRAWLLAEWKDKSHNKLQDYWYSYLKILGPHNFNFFKREQVKKTLALLNGKDLEIANKDFLEVYYVMDPLNLKGVNPNYFGNPIDLDKNGFLGLGRKIHEIDRKAWRLEGNSGKSIDQMRSLFEKKLMDYFKNLNSDPNNKKFLYEPELVTLDERNCLNDLSATSSINNLSDKCSEFKKFLNNILDEALTYYIAWGYAKKPKYKNYFNDARTYRLRLLRKLQVDMNNLSLYYTKLAENREKQSECVEKLLEGLAQSGILDSGNAGLIVGSAGQYGTSQGTLVDNLRSNPSNFFSNIKSRFSFDLEAINPFNANGTAKLDDLAVYAAGAGTKKASLSKDLSVAQKAGAERMKKMNSKAQKSGIKVEEKEKKYQEIVGSMGKSFGVAAGFSGANFSALKNSSFGDPLVSKSPKDEVSKEQASQSESTQEPGAQAYSLKYKESTNLGESSYSIEKDQSELSGQDKSRIFSHYEKNKSEYQENDADALFEKLSKAYVRNLDKVLERKKR